MNLLPVANYSTVTDNHELLVAKSNGASVVPV